MIVRHCGDETEHAAHGWELPGGDRFSCVGTDAAGAEIARRSRFRGARVELAPAPIVWGETMCQRKRCVDPAQAAIDGVPYCIAHADEEIDRLVAIELGGVEMLDKLPGLDE